jgi:hypothetical protein
MFRARVSTLVGQGEPLSKVNTKATSAPAPDVDGEARATRR